MSLLVQIVLGILSAVIGVIACYAFLERYVKPKMLQFSAPRQVLAGCEVVTAVMLSALGSIFDVFKATTWEKTPPVGSASVMLFLLGIYILVKVTAQWSKDNESKSANQLKVELGAVTEQRDVNRRILSLTDQIVDKKLARVRKSRRDNKANFTAQHLWEALNSAHQIDVILTAMHRFCHKLLETGNRLRLAVYVPVDGFLKPLYSYDGESMNCFTNQSQASMKIYDPDGAQSAVTELFHSKKSIRIIPDCQQAAKDGEFTYFREEQKKYLRSMALVKKVSHADPVGSEVMILALDTDQPNFFKQTDEPNIQSYCDAIMKRLEFELAILHCKTLTETSK